MKDQVDMSGWIDRMIPLLGWIALIGIALVAILLVLGLMTFAAWLALLFFIRLLPLIILVGAAALIWKLIQDRNRTG